MKKPDTPERTAWRATLRLMRRLRRVSTDARAYRRALRERHEAAMAVLRAIALRLR